MTQVINVSVPASYIESSELSLLKHSYQTFASELGVNVAEKLITKILQKKGSTLSLQDIQN